MRFSTGLIAAAGLARAIIVAPGSPCATKCGNVLDGTAPDELTCAQDDYLTDGHLFQECLECQLYSDYAGEGQTDTQWALCMFFIPLCLDCTLSTTSCRDLRTDIVGKDNLRYAFSYCLFGVPNNENVVTTPCITRSVHNNLGHHGGFEGGLSADTVSTTTVRHADLSKLVCNTRTCPLEPIRTLTAAFGP